MVASSGGGVFAQTGQTIPNWPHSTYSQDPWTNQAAYQQTPVVTPAGYGQPTAYGQPVAYGQPPAYDPAAYPQTQYTQPATNPAVAPAYAPTTTPVIQEPDPNAAAYGQSYSYGNTGYQNYAGGAVADYGYQAGAPATQQSTVYPPAASVQTVQNSSLENDLARLRAQVSARVDRASHRLAGDPVAEPVPGGMPAPDAHYDMQQRLNDPSQCFSESCDTCNTCEPACECCYPCSYYYAGAELLWMQAHFQENFGIVIDPPPNDNIIRPFNYDREISPRFWIGYSSASGVGVRARYWQYDHDADPVSATGAAGELLFAEVFAVNTSLARNAFAGPGETLTSEHSLELQTIDLEATTSFNASSALLLFSAGARYARMDQHFIATATTAANVIDEQVDHQHSFEGWGPTLAFELNRPFGTHGLSFYANTRGSVLFGDVNQEIHEIKNAGANLGHDSYDGEESLTIAELGFGLQYNHITQNNSLFFVRGGYEGQIWFDAGGPARTTGDMTLDGIVLGVGCQR
jgi:hypothetical protein